jgi:transposase
MTTASAVSVAEALMVELRRRGIAAPGVKHKLIVEQQVTNQVVDMGLLAQTAEPAKEVLGVERIAVVADRGYFKIEDIEACEKAGIVLYVPRPQRGPSVRAGLFRKDEFRYDPTCRAAGERASLRCRRAARLRRCCNSTAARQSGCEAALPRPTCRPKPRRVSS